MSVWVAGAALVVGLAGCAGDSGGSGGDGRPEGDELSASASATGKASPSGDPSDDVPEVPVPPAAMENFDEAGAKAFAEFYWEVVTYAQATGDTELLKSLAMSDCAVCRGGRDWVEELHASGNRVVGNVITASAGKVVAVGNVGEPGVVGYEVTTRIESQGGRVVDERGELIEKQAPDAMTLVLFVHFREQDGWALSDWTRS